MSDPTFWLLRGSIVVRPKLITKKVPPRVEPVGKCVKVSVCLISVVSNRYEIS